ncbi:MAG: LLM class flavin-dependent oxidoreductase [Frankia sp.]|nr:LLM class flavin-dependent oxidoreductase [Frankia sp.]
MASGIATIARLSNGRFRACFGTGYTSRMTIGQPPMPLKALFDYVGALRGLLAGETVMLDGKAARMLHGPGLTLPRPIQVPLWLSVFGPRGNRRAPEVADGIIGPPHPTLPSATMVTGTVLDPGEDPRSARVREAIGPWQVVRWHTAYAVGGPTAVDALPGGAQWRQALESLAPDDERHLLTFEGHVTHLAERDRPLLDHIDLDAMVGDLTTLVGDVADVRQKLARLADAGFREVSYYERRGLLAKPERTLGGHRLYPADAVTLLGVIKAAQRLGFTLDEVAELLDTGRRRHAGVDLAERALAKLDEVNARIRDLEAIRSVLTAVVEAGCDSLTDCTCPSTATAVVSSVVDDLGCGGGGVGG